MCFSALSRKRFLEKHRPGHDRVFWEPKLAKWLSYNRVQIQIIHIREASDWFIRHSIARVPRYPYPLGCREYRGHRFSMTFLDEPHPKDGDEDV